MNDYNTNILNSVKTLTKEEQKELFSSLKEEIIETKDFIDMKNYKRLEKQNESLEDENYDYRDEIEGYEDQVDELEQENDELQEKLDNFEHKLKVENLRDQFKLELVSEIFPMYELEELEQIFGVEYGKPLVKLK